MIVFKICMIHRLHFFNQIGGLKNLLQLKSICAYTKNYALQSTPANVIRASKNLITI